MSATVTADLKEVERLTKKLNKYKFTSGERLNLMNSLGLEIEEQTKERFISTQTAPDGNPWADFADVTRQYLLKQGLGNSAKLLNREGELLKSIEGQAGEWQVIVGSALEYAATHQFGAKKGAFGKTSRNAPIPWGDIPARPYLGLSSENISDLEDLIDVWLKRHIK